MNWWETPVQNYAMKFISIEYCICCSLLHSRVLSMSSAVGFELDGLHTLLLGIPTRHDVLEDQWQYLQINLRVVLHHFKLVLRILYGYHLFHLLSALLSQVSRRRFRLELFSFELVNGIG